MTSNVKRIIGAVIIVAVIIVAAFAIFHKSSTPSSSNSTASTSSGSGTPAAADSIILTKSSPALGQYLTDPSGRALYTYNADSSGMSNCTGSCLSAWPAYTAKSSVANPPTGITTIKRSDNGEVQYAYNGMPLYYFASDSGNQVTGNGVENFSVAKPAASQQKTSSQSQPANTNNSTGYPY